MADEHGVRGKLIALDADGVLLDYNLAYASAWKRAFGVYPKERDPEAYWAMDRWDVDRLSGSRLKHFQEVLDETFWSSLPALPGALDACITLAGAGFHLVCVTAMRGPYGVARSKNLQSLGFPLQDVYTTRVEAPCRSPKADVVNRLRPAAFADDYLPYFQGVAPGIHQALLTREGNGSPNRGALLDSVSSVHANLADFAEWWLSQGRSQ